ncbi:MAG: ferrochelatase [Parcubacteria group bacterium]|nr:ferrochelatase [Parcubacteria group bacterium]
MSTENNTAKNFTGVILMTYGSATTADHVEEYFERIYKGKASSATIEDFKRRYELIGHSPLVDITNSQAAHLQETLGDAYVVRAGMRHSAPFIDEAVAECKAANATSLISIILSPQFSSFIMEGYKTAFMEAAVTQGFNSEEGTAIVAGPWGIEPHFIELLARRVQESLEKLDTEYGTPVPVIFTTHSLPQRVVEKDPQYLEQLAATIDAVREKLNATHTIGSSQASETRLWFAGYQSAGHTPEEWLKPDLFDILKELKIKEAPAVLIVPIQFLTDHLEILYDLDIAAKAQCEELGIAYNRIELPNIDPLFISSLATIATSLANVHVKSM